MPLPARGDMYLTIILFFGKQFVVWDSNAKITELLNSCKDGLYTMAVKNFKIGLNVYIWLPLRLMLNFTISSDVQDRFQ